jgi:DNA-binding NarL/FixJ family response regulator
MDLLIVEDEVLLREKYVQYLEQDFSITLSSSYQEACMAINENEFDVILLDYHLPDGRGLDIAKEVQGREEAPWSPVLVMITAYSKESLAIESLNLGVFRYLEKPIDREVLLSQMLAAKSEANKRQRYDELASQFLLSEKVKTLLVKDYFVTERELEVIEKILILGKNKLVASNLFISQGTVRNHLSNIFQKLHLNSKEELRDFVHKHNH